VRLALTHARRTFAADVDDADGSMARCPTLLAFGKAHGLKVMLISDLIRYRRAREAQVERTRWRAAPHRLRLVLGVLVPLAPGWRDQSQMVMGDIGDGANVLTRVHSECLTGDIFASALRLRAAAERRHVAIGKDHSEFYLRGQEGRGMGWGTSCARTTCRTRGETPCSQANEDLGLPVDRPASM
jgi:3,4-dihydroxy 2-butanone 4-phosphate synthase/GTP cyclohydrolase II